jgi:hypothetical protein
MIVLTFSLEKLQAISFNCLVGFVIASILLMLAMLYGSKTKKACK